MEGIYSLKAKLANSKREMRSFMENFVNSSHFLSLPAPVLSARTLRWLQGEAISAVAFTDSPSDHHYRRVLVLLVSKYYGRQE